MFLGGVSCALLICGDISVLFGMRTRVVDYGQSFGADHTDLVMKMGNVILNPLKSSAFGLFPCSLTTGQVSGSGTCSPRWGIGMMHFH